ncbi:type II toxin-antitoxin system RelE/ParE family toxin [Candidatus Woesebacteria bacterium]|nr:type II toxin-antitoxin system RelE/ParE family toxin [Candidatus Woesebacteria bacterium]
MTWKVEYYVNARGESPVKKLLLGQEPRVKAKVLDAIDILTKSGPFLKPPYMKKLLPNLYELRIKSTVAVRVFYSPITSIYYLVHAFVKKTQKTPERELKIALDRVRELI